MQDRSHARACSNGIGACSGRECQRLAWTAGHKAMCKAACEQAKMLHETDRAKLPFFPFLCLKLLLRVRTHQTFCTRTHTIDSARSTNVSAQTNCSARSTGWTDHRVAMCITSFHVCALLLMSALYRNAQTLALHVQYTPGCVQPDKVDQCRFWLAAVVSALETTRPLQAHYPLGLLLLFLWKYTWASALSLRCLLFGSTSRSAKRNCNLYTKLLYGTARQIHWLSVRAAHAASTKVVLQCEKCVRVGLRPAVSVLWR